jgi:TolB-like protein
MSEMTDDKKKVIHAEIELIRKSPLFTQSRRLIRFLAFTTEKTLSGKQDELKEYLIGTEVYDRKVSFDPMHDSIVRTEARRLRQKLKEYYASGREHRVVSIHFSPGSYVPEFHFRSQPEGGRALIQHREELPCISGGPMSIVVLPFRNLSDTALGQAFADGIVEDLSHLLTQNCLCRVVASTTLVQLGLPTDCMSGLLVKLGVRIAFEGTVRVDGEEVWITARIVNSDGFQLQSHRFELSRDSAHLMRIQQQVASVLAGQITRWQSPTVWRHRAASDAVWRFDNAVFAIRESSITWCPKN